MCNINTNWPDVPIRVRLGARVFAKRTARAATARPPPASRVPAGMSVPCGTMGSTRGVRMSDAETQWRGDALWIRLNRPERRNAYDADMAAAIVEALEGASAMRSVVITGVDRSFCAGGSLASLSTPTPGDMRHLYRASLRLFDAIRTCPRPIIARAHPRQRARDVEPGRRRRLRRRPDDHEAGAGLVLRPRGIELGFPVRSPRSSSKGLRLSSKLLSAGLSLRFSARLSST